MPQLFLGNFHFEQTLAAGTGQSLSASVKRINAELATCWMLIALEGDYILLPASVEGTYWQRMQSFGFPKVIPIFSEDQIPKNNSLDPLHLVPWGWSTEMSLFAQQHHLQYNAPSLSIIRKANSRQFSAMLEEELGLSLPFAQMVSSPVEFSAATKQLSVTTNRWVVKNNFSNSARERIIGEGTTATIRAQNWMQKRWKKKIPLFLEPWVDAIEEVGIHFKIPKFGDPIFEGITPLITDARGRYCGSRIVPERSHQDSSYWKVAITTGFEVASRLQQIGYFGPVGIDAMHYLDLDGSSAIRPLQEINARWTMGRLASGIQKLLQPDEVASWLHHSASEELIQQNRPANIRLFSTSPTKINGLSPQHQTCVCITNQTEQLEKQEQLLLNRK